MKGIVLRAPRGESTRGRRPGRGRSAGQGKTCGRGTKGQKARSNGTRLGFEGGQTPLFRRIAGRGFSNSPFKAYYVAVNVGRIDRRFNEGEEVNRESLIAKGLIKKSEKKVKILGGGSVTKKLTIQFPKISSSAMLKIQQAGGFVQIEESEEP